jgi:hypothetical protein
METLLTESMISVSLLLGFLFLASTGKLDREASSGTAGNFR